MLIQCFPFEKGKQIINLGASTSYDVKNVAATYGKDYKALTINDFIICNVAPVANAKGTQLGNPHAYNATGYAGTGRVISYNASNGILTAYSTLTADATVSESWGTRTPQTITMPSLAYLLV